MGNSVGFVKEMGPGQPEKLWQPGGVILSTCLCMLKNCQSVGFHVYAQGLFQCCSYPLLVFLFSSHSGEAVSSGWRCFKNGCKLKARVFLRLRQASVNHVFLSFWQSTLKVMVVPLKPPSASREFRKSKGRTRAP